MVVLPEIDVGVPHSDVEGLVEELEVLDQDPALVVPSSPIPELPAHGCLVLGEVLVADEVVQVPREGNLEEGFEDRVSVVG